MDTGKAPDNIGSQGGNERRVNGNPGNSVPIVDVQPPRREDLQPSYSQVLHADDGDGHGWYGAMSTSACIQSFYPHIPKVATHMPYQS